MCNAYMQIMLKLNHMDFRDSWELGVPKELYTAKIFIFLLTNTFVMWVAHLYPGPYLPPMYYTITTFPYRVATVQPTTAVVIIGEYSLHGPAINFMEVKELYRGTNHRSGGK